MHSSTFNSKKYFYAFGLVIIALLLVHYIIIRLYFPEKGGKGQTQRQENEIIAENYIYSTQKYKYIIVGSSLSARMKDEMLPADCYNLSFHGGSFFTGLEIIRKSHRYPENILIEINIMEGNADTNMVKKLFSPFSFFPKNIRQLRASYQPVTLLKETIERRYGKSVTEKRQARQVPQIYNMQMQFLRKANSEEPEFDKVRSALEKLKTLVEEFKAAGVRCIFFEMPIDAEIAGLRRPVWQRSLMQKEFRPERFIWIIDQHRERYTTSDGLHLLYKSAEDFSAFLIPEVRKKCLQAGEIK